MKLHTQNIRRNIIVKHFDSLNNFKMKRHILHICPPPLMCVSVVDCTYFFFVFKKVVGWSVSREHQQRWNGSMAANLRGSGACQHFLHSRSARLRLSHHCLQFTSGQDPRRQAHSARYVSFELSSIYRLCKDLSLLCFFPPLTNKRERKCRHRRYYTSPSIVWRTEQPLDNQKTSTGCEESTGARGGQWTCNEPLFCSLSLDGKMCNKLASLFIQI